MYIKSISTRQLIRFVGSPVFFKITVAALVLQAAWIALSGGYPMAFDEEYHLGVIRLYAEHLSPFWSGIPPNSDAFGAVARDPSYIYHYLLSFPYRLMTAAGLDQTAQVITLRFINIGFFASGLLVFRRLLLKTAASSAIVNLSLLVFILIPVSPFLASQINYDNLIIPLTGLALLLTLRLTKLSNGKELHVLTLLQLIVVCLMASLVKYAFLPVLAAIAGYLAVFSWTKYRKFTDLKPAFAKGYRRLSRPVAAGLIALVLMSGGLFVERYGVNLARYHKPVADCAEVLDYDHCKHYGPWIRDYNLNQNKGDADKSPLLFSREWLYGMWLRSYFTLAGPEVGYQTKSPLMVPAIGAIVLACLSVLAMLVTARKIWRRYNRPALWLITLAALIHVVILWLEEYRLFLHAGKAVAINGRYLLPVLPIVILLSALAISQIIRNHNRLKLAASILIVASLLWGGGALTYILRSNDSWYWPNSPLAPANHVLQDTLGPLTPGYRHPSQFLR